MATWEHQLVDPPTDERAREVWLQHAAGFMGYHGWFEGDFGATPIAVTRPKAEE